LISRRGGGVDVALEKGLAHSLLALGIAADASLGIVVPPSRYFVGIVKPDVVILDPCVAIEIDNHPGDTNRHPTPDGEGDDRARDALLAEVGWRVLRIRRPDAPADGAWPWRIETTSRAPRKLASLVAEELKRDGHEPAVDERNAPGVE